MWIDDIEVKEGYKEQYSKGELAIAIMKITRQKKAERELSVRYEVEKVIVGYGVELSGIKFDLKHSCNIKHLELVNQEDREVWKYNYGCGKDVVFAKHEDLDITVDII